MPRVSEISLEKAQPKTKEILANLQKKLGTIPNIFKSMGNSPATLEGYLKLSEASAHTTLSPALREQIALIVSQINQCNYCLSAHTAIAKKAGLPEQEILLARKGEAQDPKTKAILKFAKLVIEKRGHVSNQEVQNLKASGVNDVELVEIILIISETMFTNYFNHIIDPTIDFPAIPEVH